MPEGESQVGLVDILDGNSDLSKSRERVRTGGRGLSHLPGLDP